MIMEHFLNNEYISIDIGFKNIKVVEVSVNKNSEVYLKNFGIASTPSCCIKNGVITNVNGVTKEIRKIIDESRMKVKKAKIVMSGTSIISRVFMVNRISGHETDEVVKEAILQNMPINVDEYKIDYKILQEITEGDINRVKVFVTAVRKNIIKSYVDTLIGLDLKPISIDIPANSIAKFFNREIKINRNELWYERQKYGELNQKVFAVIDFGSETTIVNILRYKILEFNKVILKGSSNIDELITKKLMRNLMISESLKKQYGITIPDMNASQEHEEVYPIIKNFIDQLIHHIYQCFNYYEMRCYGTKIGKVYIIGGGSLLKNLSKYLEDSIKIPVYPVGLLSIDGISVNGTLNEEKLNYLINCIGIAL
ncbi:MAG: pilus assembly protein PilM [Clostridiales bacterium]